MEFASKQELQAYVSQQLRLILGDGWEINESDAAWELNLRDDAWDNFQVRLWWSPEGSMLIVTHGNSDHGPMRLEQVLLKATVIDLVGLHWFPLPDLLRAVLSKEPNAWGRT